MVYLNFTARDRRQSFKFSSDEVWDERKQFVARGCFPEQCAVEGCVEEESWEAVQKEIGRSEAEC